MLNHRCNIATCQKRFVKVTVISPLPSPQGIWQQIIIQTMASTVIPAPAEFQEKLGARLHPRQKHAEMTAAYVDTAFFCHAPKTQ